MVVALVPLQPPTALRRPALAPPPTVCKLLKGGLGAVWGGLGLV